MRFTQRPGRAAQRAVPRPLSLVLALVLLLAAQLAAALEPCLECHGLIGFGVDERPLWVHEESYAMSVHRNLTCSDCHKGAEDFPHGAALRVRCDLPCHVPGATHGRVAEQEADGVHAQLGGPSCVACHGGTAAPVGEARYARCVACHPDRDRPRSLYPDSPGAFGFRAHRPKHVDARFPDCIDCHGAHGVGSGDHARQSCAAPACHPRHGEDFALLFDHRPAQVPAPWGGAGPAVLLIGAVCAALLALHGMRG